MDVVLHVGAHRTASTTFQKTLGANGAALAEAGIVYWGPKCTRSGLFDGLIGAPERLDAARRLAGLRRVALRARRAERAGARILLVSEENVLGSMRAAVSGGGFYADAGPRVAAVAEAFGALSADDRDGGARAGCLVALGPGVLRRAGRVSRGAGGHERLRGSRAAGAT
jgi:hypothetical protein